MKIVVLIASLTITVPLFSLPFSLLSIITKPIGYQGETWFHPAVTRSVIDGLRKINVPYNVNPSSVAALGDVVWVLTNEQALLQCIALKNNKIIKILLAGPNFVILPHESNRLLTHPSIDGLLLPSSAIKQVYIDDEPCLAQHTYICPAGVDTAFWHAEKKNIESRTVLIYWKTESEEFYQRVVALVKEKGWNPCLVRYGEYTHDSYKQQLSESRFAIFMSTSESQGIALSECWSMGVPTLVWNPWCCIYQGKHLALPSCPCLNPLAGQEWYSFEELELLLKDIERRLQWYNPRAWVLDTLSDEAAAYQLLNVIQCISLKRG